MTCQQKKKHVENLTSNHIELLLCAIRVFGDKQISLKKNEKLSKSFKMDTDNGMEVTDTVYDDEEMENESDKSVSSDDEDENDDKDDKDASSAKGD